MEWQEIEVVGRHTVKFADLPYVPLTSPPQSPENSELFIGKKLGGILRHGEWGWLTKNSVLQIVSLRNGQTITSYEFCESKGYESCCIKCVEEIFPNRPEVMLLAIVLESFRGPGGGCSYVAVFSVELSRVLHNIELSLHLTCARFMEASACRRSLLQNFDGCLAVGSEEGVVVLLDLNVQKLITLQNDLNEDVFVSCHIIDYSLPLTEIHRNFRQCQQDGIHFGLQMEVIESPSSIQCLLPIDLILGLAVGLEDGRLALYDLAELQIFFVAQPNPEVTMSALVKMDFLEPPDDPRPCFFIWTLHENGENLHAVLHSLMYEKRLMDEEEAVTYFETFQNGSVRLQLPLEATKSMALACQAISSSMTTHGEDDANCLCIISWLSVLEGKNKLLIFDLNQWYKEEMPFLLEYGKQPNYLAGYILNGECCGLQTLVNANNIAHFNSMQRFEEHFYPNSLSFESLLLHTKGCRRFNWEGAQNRVINLLRCSNAAIFLEPNLYFNEILRTRLMPQFIEMNLNSTFSRNAKYEILLSTALEHNCVSLLRDCAKSWIDGSFMGNFSATTGLSLSTLTDWIWKRATCIKSRCNDLCKSLFEFGGYPLDSREQKELGFITRQLKLLAELLKDILAYAKKQIPERVFADLANKQSSLSMASSYQDILLWLLNIGLLPEASPHNDKIIAGNDLIPYPYQDLKEFYKTKRSFYAKLNESFISKKSGSCKLLFIDSFIEHVCKGNILHEYWLENEGNGLYPPNSLEAMLRVMLVPDLDYDSKCAILLYFFLDLNMAIDEEVYKDVVANFIKFPSVFKLSAALIKTVQAFWNLDHDHYLSAVDEFISPFNKNQSYPQWQVELLIEVLLNQKANNLALRILESQPSLISPLLKLNTLLANDLISEAFHFVRARNDDSLMEKFFTQCLRHGQFGIIRDLALSEAEGLVLQNILRKINTPGAESLHFVYLLQKSKYIEAVSYMEEMSNRAKGLKATSLNHNNEMDTPNLVLSAFNTTMTPVTQGLTDVYFRIRNKIKKKEIDNQSPVPLSCQLIKQNANNLLGGIYHSSALSAHFATYYWGELEEQTQQTKHLLNHNNAPFLRRPQIDTNSRDFVNKNNISYPQTYKVNEKRTLLESGVLETEPDDLERHKLEHKLNPKKKRRLIGQEIVEDLQNFMKMNKTLSATEFTFAAEQQTKEIETTKNETFDLLLRPLNNKAKDIEPAKTSQGEIQGILKSHINNETTGQRDILNEEEKNLRFKLPSIEKSFVTVKQTAEEPTPNDEVIEKSKANAEEQLVETKPSPKFKHFSRSVSVESCKSSDSKSVENYYSPLSSHNNSKLDTSNLSILSILSGPQPRKPLARFSAERSEKSLTPEPVITMEENTQYLTALETNIKSKISPRSALTNLNTEQEVGKEPSNLAYVTAKETLSPTQSLDSFKTKEAEEVTQTTSGFGSLSSSQMTLAGSKISEFLPKESSSKVGAANEHLKLSECSTVLGTLTTLESMAYNTNYNFAMPGQTQTANNLQKLTDEQKRHMMETTLSMSTYDISIFESTSLQQTQSSLMVTAKDSASADKMEVGKEPEIERKEKEEESLQPKGEEEGKAETANSPSKLPNPKEESNDVCILLSSSCSSASSKSSLKQQDEVYEDNYSDYEREEDEEGYEMDNEDYENEFDDNENIEDLDIMEDEENFDNEEENDYDEDSHNEDISMEGSENSSVNENADDIHFIEDSSSDIRQQNESFYSDSDSDDVKVIEDDISTDVIEENMNIKETDIKEKTVVEGNTSNTDKTLALSTKEAEEVTLKSTAEKRDEKGIASLTLSQIIMGINEPVSSSTTEVVIEQEGDTSKEDKSFLLLKKQAEEVTFKSDAEKHEEKKIISNTLSEIDMLVNEAVSTSTTEEVTKKQRNTSKAEAEKLPSDSTEKPKEIAIIGKSSMETDEAASISRTEVVTEKDLKDLKENVATGNQEEKLEQTETENITKEKEKQEEHFQIMETLAAKGDQEGKKEIIKEPRDTQSEPQSVKSNEPSTSKSQIFTESTTTKQALKEPITSFLTLDNSKIPLEEATKSPVKEKAVENFEKKAESLSDKIENSESLETKSPAKENAVENIEKKADSLSEKIEKSESLEESSMSLRMEDSNDDTPENIEIKGYVKEKEESCGETVTETLNAKLVNKVSFKAREGEQNLTEQTVELGLNVLEEKPKSKIREKSESAEGKAEKEERKIEVESKSNVCGDKTSSEENAKNEIKEITAVSYENKEKQKPQSIQSETKADALEDKSNSEEKSENKMEGKLQLTIENRDKEEPQTSEMDAEPDKDPKLSPSKRKSNSEEKSGNIIEEKLQFTIKNRDKEEPQTSEMEAEPDKDPKLLQSKRKTTRRSSSVPPRELEPTLTKEDSITSQNTRNIAVPAQTIRELEEQANLTPRTRRSMRATSLQPKSKLENNEVAGTPSKIKENHESAGSETRATRGSSLPPGAVEGKLTRRRSILLESINEDGSVLDSPSARTRLKSRLNSVESEVDSPVLMQQKLSRKMSLSNNSHDTPLTPKRTRSDSLSSQPETSASLATPRSLRARSVLTVQEEETLQTPKRKRRDSVASHSETNVSHGTPRSLRSKSVLSLQEEEDATDETMSSSSKATSSKKNDLKRQKKFEEPVLEQSSPHSDSSPISEASYSSTRRLTRTQLAVMAKSAALAQATSTTKAHATMSPIQHKRPKSRAMRSSQANVDSDDAESTSSKVSTASNATGSKRITRSSLKEKDGNDDDGASIASSLGSEKHLRTRRSKDKSSPNTTLTTIPEDEPIEPKKRGRPLKH